MKSVTIREGETLYVKRGKEYFEVSDPYAASGLKLGSWLVTVRYDGRSIKSIKEKIKPDYLAVDAALVNCTEPLIKVISEATKGSCREVLTLEEKGALEILNKRTVWFKSTYDVAQDIIDYLRIHCIMELNKFEPK